MLIQGGFTLKRTVYKGVDLGAWSSGPKHSNTVYQPSKAQRGKQKERLLEPRETESHRLRNIEYSKLQFKDRDTTL